MKDSPLYFCRERLLNLWGKERSHSIMRVIDDDRYTLLRFPKRDSCFGRQRKAHILYSAEIILFAPSWLEYGRDNTICSNLKKDRFVDSKQTYEFRFNLFLLRHFDKHRRR